MPDTRSYEPSAGDVHGADSVTVGRRDRSWYPLNGPGGLPIVHAAGELATSDDWRALASRLLVTSPKGLMAGMCVAGPRGRGPWFSGSFGATSALQACSVSMLDSQIVQHA